MSLTPEALYVQLGRLIESMPDLSAYPISSETHRWLGRAVALVSQLDDVLDLAQLKISIDRLHADRSVNHQHIISAVLYRALAMAELQAPIGAQGAFIPVGNSFDAFGAIGKVLSVAKQEILIVDPYMDEKALMDFALLAPENVTIRLLADEKDYKASLKPAMSRWISQYGSKRPLNVRLASARQLHDRLIAVDQTDVWTLTQSLNAFAARSPASIVKVDPETARLKIAAYETMWASAKAI